MHFNKKTETQSKVVEEGYLNLKCETDVSEMMISQLKIIHFTKSRRKKCDNITKSRGKKCKKSQKVVQENVKKICLLRKKNIYLPKIKTDYYVQKDN